MKSIALVTLLFITASCATLNESFYLGAGIGVASGVSTAAITKQRAPGFAVLGIIGGVLGGVAATLLHKNKSQVPDQKEIQKTNTEFSPSLSIPTFRCFSVDEKIEGVTIEQAHTKCVIERQGAWTK